MGLGLNFYSTGVTCWTVADMNWIWVYRSMRKEMMRYSNNSCQSAKSSKCNAFSLVVNSLYESWHTYPTSDYLAFTRMWALLTKWFCFGILNPVNEWADQVLRFAYGGEKAPGPPHQGTYFEQIQKTLESHQGLRRRAAQ